MRTHRMHQPASGSPAVPANGAMAGPAMSGLAARAPAFRSALSMPVELCAIAGALAGLWVAISPWFLTLQTSRGANATASDLIVGLVIVVLGLLTVTGARSLAGLQAASLLAGVWLIISPFILDAKVPITGSMYWSNIWSGAVVIVAALAALGLIRLQHPAG